MSDVGFCPRCQKELATLAGKCVICSSPVEPRAPGGPAVALAWLRARPWVVAVPPWLVFGAFCAVSKAAWVQQASHNRLGTPTGTTTPAATGFAALVLTTGLFLGAPLLPRVSQVRARPVTAMDAGCALVFIQVLALVLEYVVVGALVLRP
jgi:hypothetical protein